MMSILAAGGAKGRTTLSYTFSSNTANASLNLSSIGGYSAGNSDITVTVNSGVYLYSTSTGGYGLNLSGGTAGDTLTIVNNGYIMGMGGAGGGYVGGSTARPGSAGGPAINFGFSLSGATVTNTSGYIGGGGGGGASGPNNSGGYVGGAGGGAGGGKGGSNDQSGPGAYGGNGGGIGSSGSNGSYYSFYHKGSQYTFSGGGGGGRIMPGSGGSTNQGGNGGGAGGGGGWDYYSNAGGNGGSAGNAGTGSGSGGGGGGGWGASGGNVPNYGASGYAGGKAINLNGKSITWTGGSSSSSRSYGAVS